MTQRVIDLDTPYGRLRITWPADSLVWNGAGGWAEQGTEPPDASLDWQPIPIQRAQAILTAMLNRRTDLTPPDWINTDPERLTIWREYLQIALARGRTAHLTTHNLSRLVEAAYQHDVNARIIAARGMYLTPDGRQVNPAVALRERAAANVDRLEQQLGLTQRPATEPMTATDPMTIRGRWCETHKRWECTSNRVKGQGLCHSLAAIGLGRCKNHAGVKVSTSPAHILAVEHLHNPIAGEPMKISPARGLLWRVEHIAGELARLDDYIAALQAEEVTWGLVSEVDDEEHGKRKTWAARLNLWVAYREDRERAFRLSCEAAIQAGVAAELVRLAREQGDLVARVMVAFAVEDLGLARDDERIVTALPRRLRELTG